MHLFSKKADKKMAAYQKELVETHYQEVDNMYRQMRGWRHDYRNHIQTMKAYAATENWDAIRHYLDLLDKDLTTVDTVIKTGNAMTDAILNSKISLARSKDIQVIADADIPVKLNSSEIDLCCITACFSCPYKCGSVVFLWEAAGWLLWHCRINFQ